MITALVILVLVVAAFVLYVATRPNSFRIQRSTQINAPAERIYPLIASFHEWGKWSPYEKMDPAMKRAFGGVASGTGATYAWDGNSRAGSGSMQILDATPSSRVLIKLDFSKPFVAHNTAEFTISSSAGGSTVTWAMYGPALLASKVMGLFMSMDNMVGAQFEEGLTNLKRVSEA
jgi:Polyketide cyclase / dehydrase and lipid transport